MKLKIDEPCSEDWNKMQIGLNSRHCDVCAKSVIDFTTMSRAEIILYILDRPNESVCGRLRPDQFDFRHDDVPVLMEALRDRRPTNAFLILALVALSLASCSEPNGGQIKTKKPAIERNIRGDVSIEKFEDHHESKKVSDTLGKVEKGSEPLERTVKGEVLAGGICVREPDVLGEIEPPIPPPPVANPQDEIISFAEVMPEFPGGMEALMAFINLNLKYPAADRENGIEGNMYVNFVVEKDGSLTHFKILRSVSGSVGMDQEAKRLILSMPKWTPGMQNGVPRRVSYTLPIRFKLR